MAEIMYYTVYKTTNKINGKIYIGCHKTKVIDDGYIGSGIYLRRAIDKHGIENFEKEILAVFDKSSDMFEMESELVNEDFVKDDTNYNLKVGGLGGWDHIDKSEACRITNLILAEKRKCPEYDKRFRDNCGNAFKGKSHSPESKKKIGSANSIYQKGNGNSNYGNMWIYNPELKENKTIKRNDEIPDGWMKGRKMSFYSS